MPDPIFTGHVDDSGKVHLDSPRVFSAYKKRLAGFGIEVVLRKQRTRRSLDQNNYWWAVPVKLMSEFMGEDLSSTHCSLLGACWGYHLNEKLNREMPNKGSSKALTSDEFSFMIEWAPVWAMETFGVQIPLPHEADS
jgi:hypothetical protein